jgi:Ca2+-transporting ATPase
VETLGAVNIICSDKTGTLTEDQMTVRRIYVDNKIVSVTGAGYEPVGELKYDGLVYDNNNVALAQLIQIGSLCNDSHLIKKDKWVITGDPTEGALVVLAAKSRFEQRCAAGPYLTYRRGSVYLGKKTHDHLPRN